MKDAVESKIEISASPMCCFETISDYESYRSGKTLSKKRLSLTTKMGVPASSNTNWTLFSKPWNTPCAMNISSMIRKICFFSWVSIDGDFKRSRAVTCSPNKRKTVPSPPIASISIWEYGLRDSLSTLLKPKGCANVWKP